MKVKRLVPELNAVYIKRHSSYRHINIVYKRSISIIWLLHDKNCKCLWRNKEERKSYPPILSSCVKKIGGSKLSKISLSLLLTTWLVADCVRSKSELVEILLVQLVALCLTVELVTLLLSPKWNSKTDVTKWISKGILLFWLVILTYGFNEQQRIARET